jgi:hypothetical protein
MTWSRGEVDLREPRSMVRLPAAHTEWRSTAAILYDYEGGVRGII